MVTLADAYAVKERVQPSLLAIPGVHAVGVGGKSTGGRATGEAVIQVFVVKKKPVGEVPADQLIPAEIDGVKTDVIEAAEPQPYGTLDGGIEIQVLPTVSGGGMMTVGTLGCFATTNGSPSKTVLLSNHHVLYGLPPTLGPGDEVRLTSSCGCCEDLIAHVLTGFRDSIVDAAIAEVVPGQQVRGRVHDVPITGILDLRLQNAANIPPAVQAQIVNLTYTVHKYGAKTSLTHGILQSVNVGAQNLNHQFHITPKGGSDFAQQGDSGSVIYNDAGQVIALLWGGAGDPSDGIGSPIAEVVSKLNITIKTNPPVTAFRVPEKPENVIVVERVYRDLRESGASEHVVALYGKHQAEFRELLRNRRRFVVAWHRHRGPLLVRSVKDLAERRLEALPDKLDGESWVDSVRGIAEAILLDGSQELTRDTRLYMPLIAQCGGLTYAETLSLLSKVGDLEGVGS